MAPNPKSPKGIHCLFCKADISREPSFEAVGEVGSRRQLNTWLFGTLGDGPLCPSRSHARVCVGSLLSDAVSRLRDCR